MAAKTVTEIQVGQKVRLLDRTFVITKLAGKEIRLEAPRTPKLPAQLVYRNRRTIEKLLRIEPQDAMPAERPATWNAEEVRS